MTAIFFDRKIDDDTRRGRLYDGDIFVYHPTDASMELVELAREVLREGFGSIDPTTAQNELDVSEWVSIMTPLKKKFIEHPRCLEIQPRLLASLGCDLEQVHFDIPRMRSSCSGDFLRSGIAYQFHAHRDTWYSAPMCQINWWIPIFDVEAENVMAFHPRYMKRPVSNTSETYNYQHWNANLRYTAHQHIGKDTRPQPHIQGEVDLEPSIVVVMPPGGIMLFSAAQLHSSLPHHTGVTRYSIDFRTVHRSDIEVLRGAMNVDARCTGSAINDYRRGTDLSRLPMEVQDMYLPGHPQGIQLPDVAGDPA
jgi:hypothetical protein